MTDSTNSWRVCGIAGSLREGSFNRALLRAARELAPAELEIVIFDELGRVPMFDADVEAEGDPDGVVALKEAIAAADGLLLVTPEYNAGVPAPMKNAVDWASRRHAGGAPVLKNMPTAVMGATPGLLGTARSQANLRISLANTGAIVMEQPQVHLMRAKDRIIDGELVDEDSRKFVRALLASFADWIGRFRD
ncbi:MAG: NADPH-dependent FMN reductase [Gemmatimonadota bacterium]|nr:NADPH-dependent FMN reductase [Gemmatimonadota bacterium]